MNHLDGTVEGLVVRVTVAMEHSRLLDFVVDFAVCLIHEIRENPAGLLKNAGKIAVPFALFAGFVVTGALIDHVKAAGVGALVGFFVGLVMLCALRRD